MEVSFYHIEPIEKGHSTRAPNLTRMAEESDTLPTLELKGLDTCFSPTAESAGFEPALKTGVTYFINEHQRFGMTSLFPGGGVRGGFLSMAVS